jgi:DNA-binding MarR family transcriptional regulator
MDPLKEAFRKIKEDMDVLRGEILSLNQEIREIKDKLDANINPTHNPQISVETDISPTDIPLFKALKPKNMPFSTGNGGVPTNKQTNQQTNQQTEIRGNSMENALKVLNSLDSIKKEIRLKFKDLTEQEFLVFSTLYQLEENEGNCDYKTLSEKLGLSESSVRDYIGKLIKKGIPVDKAKIKNKNIKLSVSPNLKKIVSLSTILQLRGI